MSLGAISAFNQSQVQSQFGISVAKNALDAQTEAATALINGFNQVESTISTAAKEPGKGQLFDAHA